MSFSLDCPCGVRIEVVASQAGSQINCRCGQELRVPSLSQLRETAGRDAYNTSALDTVRDLLRDGALPGGKNCLISGVPTNDVCTVDVICETTWFKKPSLANRIARGLLAINPIYLLATLFDNRREEGEVFGDDLEISLPLRIHRLRKPDLRRMNQAALRQLLRKVPVYAQLLDEYPRAEVRVCPSEGGRH